MRRAVIVAVLAAAVVVPGGLGTPAARADTVSWSSLGSLSATIAQVDPGGATALADGTLLTTWAQSTSVGGSQTPYVGTTSAGGNTQTILDVAGATAAQPVVAASDDGSVRVAAWKSTSGATRVLRWSRWTGSGWTPAATLLPNVSETIELDLQLSRDGTFGVLAAVSAGGSLFAYRFNGTSFAGADTIASAASVDHPVAAVAGRAQRAIVGWTQIPVGESATALLGRRWNGASWGAVMDVSQEPAGRSTEQGAIAMSADGEKAMAAWRSEQAGSWTAAAATATGESWSAPSPLTSSAYVAVGSIGLGAADDVSTAQVAFSAKTSAAGDNVYVMSNRYAASAWSGSSVRSGPFRPEADPHPSLAMSRDGSRGLLLYQEWDSSGNKRPRALRYAGDAWGSPLGASLDAINANSRSGVGRALLNGNGSLGGAVWRQVGGGQETARASRLTIRTAPSAPREVTAQAVSTTAALVSWTASDFDGNWPFPDYTALPDPGDGTACTTISTSCVVSGLLPGKTYRFSVFAGNVEGETISQPSAAVTMPGGAPAPPGAGGTPPPPVVTPSSAAPGAVTRLAVAQRKKVDRRRRTVLVRWASAVRATGYRVRISKPGGKPWRAWTTQKTTSKRYRLAAGRAYKVSVQPVAGTVKGAAVVKTFRVKR